ncbi:FAD-dependent oxidoreductase [Altererythrobacter sp. BO-6]|uniref:FAD-dependent oxidoreductase n=1 Tax=Altererythrobacter sp. BO-6 TaxID=2604537 RepID=UPI0013E12C22|nr:FAD-dependent oxidoreductase [Altererythrobacter sp. BO-6]QIG53628.1 FAD-dependent oxidoreductase [Altererythrobacter sp. BO-6]
MGEVSVIRTNSVDTIIDIPVVIIGGGGTGLCAALAVRDAGVDVVVIERDSQPMGTTSMSTGLIPGAGSKIQRAKDIDDSPELFAKDIAGKAKGLVDAALVAHLAAESGPTIDWLVDKHGLDLSLVEGFTYPGHSALRMHGMPSRSGGELMGALASACEDAGVDILTNSLVDTIYVNNDDRVIAVAATHPDGATDVIGCEALILACCGFAGNQAMVRELIPELEHATFHGHPGNKGHAIAWGKELGAAMADLSAYQGHAGLAAGYGIPILWPLITEGGIQVNRAGQRFANEAAGYSEQAVEVLKQDGHVAWSIYDEQRHEIMKQFDDYQQAMSAGCLHSADSLTELAAKIGVDATGLEASIAETHELIASGERDQFGRSFAGKAPLSAPFYAVKVTGALFHTQGGLEVDQHARVRKASGGIMPNLYAGGGAARGISGPGADGYMAGNGLLTATTLGRLAGEHAASLVRDKAN